MNLDLKTKSKLNIIKCPHCGWEYLPGEIYLPDEVTGYPENVIRDVLGKILYVEYKEDREPDTTEHFICENCNKQFAVEVTTTYKSRFEDPEIDFSNQFTSLID